MQNRITPDRISSLNPNEIFVFGSNEAGRHGAGAARTAMQWGATYGQSFGLQGWTFAIPTMNRFISGALSTDEIRKYVDKFIEFAKSRPDLKFLVTEIGCGLARCNIKDIAPLFKGCTSLDNVYLPKRFWDIIHI